MRLLPTRLRREGVFLTHRLLVLGSGGAVRGPTSVTVGGLCSFVPLSRSFFTSSSFQRSTRFFSSQLAGAASPSPISANGGLNTPSSASPSLSSSPPSSSTSSSTSSSSPPPPPPSPKLPYNARTAQAVSETIPEVVSAEEEGEACPMILAQVEEDYTLPHPIWKPEETARISVTHRMTETTLDTLAYWTIKITRFNFDVMSGWMWGIPNKSKVLNRIVFLESIAGVPGSVASTLRHLASLRRLKRDHGWIHTLLEEAENERMHLLTFLELQQPGRVMRGAVWLSQGVFFNFFFLAYLVSPRFCHRMVGFLEEEAVKTYTEILKLIDGRFIEDWLTEKPPVIAIKYWKMSEDATMRDLILQVRADESHHREVNHCLADLEPGQLNPYKSGK